MDTQNAEKTAHLGVAFLATDEKLLWRFLDLTGISPMHLRAMSEEPGFMCAVLAFFLNHEPSLIAFAESQGIDPADVAAAHGVLCDQEQPVA